MAAQLAHPRNAAPPPGQPAAVSTSTRWPSASLPAVPQLALEPEAVARLALEPDPAPRPRMLGLWRGSMTAGDAARSPDRRSGMQQVSGQERTDEERRDGRGR